MTKPAAGPVKAAIRDALKDAGMSQQDLADRLGLSSKHVSQVLTGKVEGSLELVERMAAACGLAVVAVPAPWPGDGVPLHLIEARQRMHRAVLAAEIAALGTGSLAIGQEQGVVINDAYAEVTAAARNLTGTQYAWERYREERQAGRVNLEPQGHNCRFEYCQAPTGECEIPE